MTAEAACRPFGRRAATVAALLFAGCGPSYGELPDRSYSSFVGIGPEHLSVEFVQYVDASGRRVELLSSLAFASPEFYAALRERAAGASALLVHDQAPKHVRANPSLLGYFDPQARVEAEYLGLAVEHDELADLFAARESVAVLDPKSASVTEAELRSAFQAAEPREPFPSNDLSIAEQELDPAKLLGASAPSRQRGDWRNASADERRERRRAFAPTVRQLAASRARDRSHFAADEARMLTLVRDALDRGVRHVAIIARVPWMYGFEQRLQTELGLRRETGEWVVAWRIE